MDDEKTITEKLTDAIGKATDSVKSTLSNIVDTASEAAQHAMESNAEKMSRQPATELYSEQLAATTNDQIYLPEAADAAAMPAPLFAAQSVPGKQRKPRSKLSSSKTPPAPKKAAAKTSKKKAG
jgi:hypothetical protein